jgi:ADP-ribosylation factor GTPase-activating protein 1
MGASRTISENIIQPGMEKVMDPNFQASVKGYVSEAGKRAGEVGYTANTWAKHTLGVDVAEGVTGVVGTVRDRVGGGPQRQGYGVMQQGGMGETSALYQDNDEDDFFDAFESAPAAGGSTLSSQPANNSLTSRSGATATKKDDGWDEWKDF